jgi:hypothetical protein
VNVIADPDHADTATTLEAMRDQRLMLAHAVHSAPGRTGSRTTVGVGAHSPSAHRVHPVRIGWGRCGGAGRLRAACFSLAWVVVKEKCGGCATNGCAAPSPSMSRIPRGVVHSRPVVSARWIGCTQ